MAVDFTVPVKTQNYDTGVLQSIRANQQAIASFLDGASITGNFAGLKRYNASSNLFEKSDGSAWTEMVLAYAKLAGATFTGAVVLAADPTAALQPATKQYTDAGLATKAPSSALAAYAPLAGASFSGAVATSSTMAAAAGFSSSAGGVSVTGDISGANFASVGGGGIRYSLKDTSVAADNRLWDIILGSTEFFIRAVNDANTSASNAIAITRSGAMVTGLTMGALTQVNGGVIVNVDVGGGYGGYLTLKNPTSGFQALFRVHDSGGVELVNSAGTAVSHQFNDVGNYIAAGLIFGRGGGAGLGQIHLQAGGSPSGGAPGDLWFIY